MYLIYNAETTINYWLPTLIGEEALNFHKNKALDAAVIRGLGKAGKLSNGKTILYGNGLELSPPDAKFQYTYHGGSYDGFITFLIRVPSEKVSLIYLSNNESIEFNLNDAK